MTSGTPADITTDQLTASDLTDQQHHRAALTVAHHATNRIECEELLRMLGLLDTHFLYPLTPSKRFARTPAGAATRKARRAHHKETG